MALTLRLVKGDTLTFEEMDDNFIFLSSSKLETNLSNITPGSISSPSQGTLQAGSTAVDLGLQTGDSPIFQNLQINGQLAVFGSLTSINSTALEIKDKFILLNSGSNIPKEGGLIVDQGNGTGKAFFYDQETSRWGLTSSLSGNSESAKPDAFLSSVVTSSIQEYEKVGNIRVDLDTGDIFIYS